MDRDVPVLMRMSSRSGLRENRSMGYAHSEVPLRLVGRSASSSTTQTSVRSLERDAETEFDGVKARGTPLLDEALRDWIRLRSPLTPKPASVTDTKVAALTSPLRDQAHHVVES